MPAGRPKGSKNANPPSSATLNKATSKNITLTGDAAATFHKMRDHFNENSGYPFTLTNSQFVLELSKSYWLKAGAVELDVIEKPKGERFI